MFSNIFRELGLSPLTERVFNELVEQGVTTPRQLAERLAIPRPSVYDHARILIQKGLITERIEDNKKVFCVDDLKNIPELLQSKIDLLQKEKKQLEHILPSLLKKVAFVEPKIKFYSGPEGVRQVMNHIMWHRNIDTIIMWPMSEIIKVLGEDYLLELNKKRIKRNISVRGIWPKDKVVSLKKYPFLGVGGGHLRETRIAPKGMNWDMGYWLYDDKVVFLSSQKETFGFVVHSRDFSKLLKTQFDEIWKNSTPIKPEPQYTNKFLDGIDSK